MRSRSGLEDPADHDPAFDDGERRERASTGSEFPPDEKAAQHSARDSSPNPDSEVGDVTARTIGGDGLQDSALDDLLHELRALEGGQQAKPSGGQVPAEGMAAAMPAPAPQETGDRRHLRAISAYRTGASGERHKRMRPGLVFNADL